MGSKEMAEQILGETTALAFNIRKRPKTKAQASILCFVAYITMTHLNRAES